MRTRTSSRLPALLLTLLFVVSATVFAAVPFGAITRTAVTPVFASSPYEDTKVSGSLTASWNGSGTEVTGSTVKINSPASSVLSVALTGTFTATAQFEGTIDGSTWFAATASPVTGGATVTSATATGQWNVQYAGLRQARVRCSAYTSGTIVVTLLTTSGSPSPFGSTTTVSGTVSVTGLPAAAAMADATANPTVTQLEMLPMVFNGTTWDRCRDMAAANAQAAFTGVPAVGPMVLDVNSSTIRRLISAASTTTGVTGVSNPGSGSLVWDGSLFRPQAADASGRTTVVGAAAAGAAVAGNPVQVGGIDGSGNAQAHLQDSQKNLMVTLRGTNTTTASTIQALGDTASNGNGLIVFAGQEDFNGGNWDRHRSNVEVTLLASSSRTSTQTSADIVTYNAGAIVVIYDNTVGSTYSDTLTIDGKDPASGKYYNLLTSAAIATVTTNVYTVDPAIPAVANVTAQKRLPRTIRIVITSGNANAHTYSVGYILQPT